MPDWLRHIPLGPLDWLLVAGYFALVLAVGLYAGRKKETDTADYVVGNRSAPWWAALLSLIATEISAATFLGAPGEAYRSGLVFLQAALGAFAARIFVGFFFIRMFHDSGCLSIYEWLRDRFGPKTHRTAAVLFLLTRVLANGVRLMIAAKGFEYLLGVPFLVALAIFTGVTLAYSVAGGIRSVIWTDTVQAVIFITAGGAMVWFLLKHVGWEQLETIGSAAVPDRWTVFHWTPAQDKSWFNDPFYFWPAFGTGFLYAAASLGCDQDLTQRLLACRSSKDARKSMVLSGLISLPVTAGFLAIGVGLYVFYQLHPEPGLPGSDNIFPWFIKTQLGEGLKGLMLVGVLAVAMSSLDSAMGAMGSSALVDLYRPLRPGLTERHYLFMSKVFFVLAGVVLGLVAWLLRDGSDYLWLCFQIGSVTYGPLLGLFLLGVFTKRGTDRGNLLAAISALAVSAEILIFVKTKDFDLAWNWIMVIGTALTVGLGALGTNPKKNGPRP